MEKKKFNDVLEEKYQKYECVTLIILTAILIIAWIASSKLTIAILGKDLTKQLNLYLQGSVIITLGITTVTMRAIGWKIIAVIINFIMRKKGEEWFTLPLLFLYANYIGIINIGIIHSWNAYRFNWEIT